MSIETVRAFLLCCAAINYGLLLCWVLVFLVRPLHDGIHRHTNRWFRLSVEQFDSINYAGIVLYKVGVLLFNLVPFVALLLVR
jgi:hypothetical protein